MTPSKTSDGFTFVEIMIALAAIVIMFGSMASAFLSIKSLNSVSRHHVQAAETVRGKIETLKGTPFGNIINSTAVVPYDAGNDGIFGTADDLTGTLTVTIGDFLDMDSDTNTTETSIDSDGDGVNDPTAAVPVRVTFTWTQWVLGRMKTYTVNADTLMAA